MARPIPDSLRQPQHQSGIAILPDNAVVFVSHGHRGEPIYICMGPGDHTLMQKAISPSHALQMAQLLIQAAATELAHPKREE